MAGNAAAGLDPNLGRRQVDLVVEDDDVADPDLVEMRGLRHCEAGLVHERSGQQQQHLFAGERALGGDALKPPPPRSKAVAAGDGIDAMKPILWRLPA